MRLCKTDAISKCIAFEFDVTQFMPYSVYTLSSDFLDITLWLRCSPIRLLLTARGMLTSRQPSFSCWLLAAVSLCSRWTKQRIKRFIDTEQKSLFAFLASWFDKYAAGFHGCINFLCAYSWPCHHISSQVPSCYIRYSSLGLHGYIHMFVPLFW